MSADRMRLDERVSTQAPWTVVVPVKSFAVAKSRLSGGASANAALAAAFLLDTLRAVRAAASVGEIVLATRDPEASSVGASVGAAVVDDTGHDGINAAARHAARSRAGTGGVAIVVSDLPCLTPAALDLVLGLALEHRTSFVGDLDGTGTTMWLTATGAPLRPAFGVRSRAVHLAAGDADLVALYPELLPALVPARRDVDTDAALGHARDVGLGSASVAALQSVVRP